MADLVLSGKNFQAADLPEYRAVISPDLRLHYVSTGTDTRLSGTVTLDKAEIAPTGFSGAVSSSADVIIVDDDEDEVLQAIADELGNLKTDDGSMEHFWIIDSEQNRPTNKPEPGLGRPPAAG